VKVSQRQVRSKFDVEPADLRFVDSACVRFKHIVANSGIELLEVVVNIPAGAAVHAALAEVILEDRILRGASP
jgi:tetrahydrodipicolinate N-succinyltransferase